jgi:glycosyltransferase involved in cell wall biosynthesis
MITYNQADFVADAIQSVIDQDYPNIQLVISDDASSDDTPAIIRDFYEKNPEVILPNINKTNVGITKNFNLALEKCKGEYVAFLDGDDIFFPGKLSHQQEFMSENPQFAISYHDIEVFLSTTGEHIYNWQDRFIGRNISVAELVRFGPILPYPGVMIRRECMPHQLNENIPVGSDWLMWIVSLINCNGQAGYIDLTLGRYRRHSGNVTKYWDWKIKDQLSTLAVVEKTWPVLSAASKKRKAEIYLIDTILNLRKREFGKALKAVGLMVKYAFPNFLTLLRLPIREITFFISARGRLDDLVKSLFKEI